MLKNFKSSWKLSRESTKLFFKYPKFLVPLLLNWTFYALIVLYLKFSVNWELFTMGETFLVAFGVILFFALLLTFSCSVLLELIQQLESGRELSLTVAMINSLNKSLLRSLPIVLIWSILWFILIIIQAFLSKKADQNNSNEEFSAENITKTLSGFERMTFPRVLFKTLGKGMRMVIFLILPAIVWDNLSFKKAIKKGYKVFETHLSAFATGLVLTEVAAFIVFFPSAVILQIASESVAPFPEWVWLIVILYIAFAWSYSMYLEQMFSAELYLWNRKWEKEVNLAGQENRAIPALGDVDRPSLLDEDYELV